MDITRLKIHLSESLNAFAPNELAYLSLTSKNELAVRDRLAYRIFATNPNLVVSREYDKVDLAVFDDNSNALNMTHMIELKSWYTFDLFHQMGKIAQATNGDFAKEKNVKMLQEKHRDAKQYAIIIATHPKQEIALKYAGVVKYIAPLNKMTRSGALREIPGVCDRNIRQAYATPAYRVEQVSCQAGAAFGCEVDVYAWIIEKMK